MKTNPVQSFILSQKQHFTTAAAVAGVWPEVRQKVVSDFLIRLKARLKRRLKKWELGPFGEPLTDPQGAGFYCQKLTWKGDYSVNLQFCNRGQKIVFGLARAYEKQHIKDRRHCEEVLAAISSPNRYPSAQPNSWYEAEVTMKDPATDWTSPDVLWQMHTDRQFLEEVAAHLLAIAEVSEPIIDRLSRKK